MKLQKRMKESEWSQGNMVQGHWPRLTTTRYASWNVTYQIAALTNTALVSRTTDADNKWRLLLLQDVSCGSFVCRKGKEGKGGLRGKVRVTNVLKEKEKVTLNKNVKQ